MLPEDLKTYTLHAFSQFRKASHKCFAVAQPRQSEIIFQGILL